jgi:hypothetical protein
MKHLGILWTLARLLLGIDQYEEAKRLFKELGFRTFKDWHEYYLRREMYYSSS